MEKLIVASQNKGKIDEIKSILGDKYIIITALEAGITADIQETGSTFLENALIKAKEINRLTGCPAISDDSGLCVVALGGAPGIFSARYGGTHGNDSNNNQLLLKNMQGQINREAYFESAVALVISDKQYFTGSGRVYGNILNTEIGTNGFGYDPLFYSLELNKSFGDASAQEKNSISHRRRALDDLLSKLNRGN